MKVWILCATLTIANLTSGLAHADCAYPKAPEATPDGASASKDQMVSAMDAFKQYNADVTSYLTCLETDVAEQSKGASPPAIVQIKALQSRKHNAAVSELKAKADKFNEQVRIFKGRST